MGTIEFISFNELLLKAHIITYGNEANGMLTEMMRSEIETMWNEPYGTVQFSGKKYFLIFKITAQCNPQVTPDEILMNYNPENNYFRIENYVNGNISFVDDIGSNTGYFLKENLYAGSTTAAHEFGHTLGLKHPSYLDLRGKGIPGIMYPRGTIVDPQYQYDPAKRPGEKGGTMHPVYRKVKKEDIAMLSISSLVQNKNILVVGDFSNVWHDAHSRVV